MKNERINIVLIALFLVLLFSEAANAVPFGTFDPRSLAMGGTGVASGTSANAAYYNPALMAMYKTRKEIGGNSRFMFPVSSIKGARSVGTIAEVEDEQLEQDLVDAINAFNTNQSSQNARAVLNAAADLDNNLDDLLDGPVQADVNAAMVFAIGHRREGGSIIINKRAVGDGAVENFESDLQLLEDYVNAMAFIEGGGNPVDAAALYPNVVDPDGTIRDQTGDLVSEAAGSGVIITEVGMAMSRQFEIYGEKIALGITPKIMQVVTYDFAADATTGDSDTVRDDNEDFDINMDIGAAYEIDSHWRAGVVIKNIRSLGYTTSLGNRINLDPQVRAGVSYDLGRRGLYAFDLDLIENDAVGTGSPSQMMSLGIEWPLAPLLKLRGGVTRNIKGIGAGNDVLYSLGAHWGLGLIIDLALAYSDYEVAAGFQLGTSF